MGAPHHGEDAPGTRRTRRPARRVHLPFAESDDLADLSDVGQVTCPNCTCSAPSLETALRTAALTLAMAAGPDAFARVRAKLEEYDRREAERDPEEMLHL